MRPPECARCDEKLEPGDSSGPSGGSLVTFRRSERDEEWHRRSEDEGFVGHPPNVDWFCAAHLERARQLCDRTLAEAMAAWDAPAES